MGNKKKNKKTRKKQGGTSSSTTHDTSSHPINDNNNNNTTSLEDEQQTSTSFGGSEIDVVNLDDTDLVDVLGNDSKEGLNHLMTGANDDDDDDDDDDNNEMSSEDTRIDVGTLVVETNSSNNKDDMEDDNQEEIAIGLTSFHSNLVHPPASPIGNPKEILESSFLDVPGDEELRGPGTPPGTSIGGSRFVGGSPVSAASSWSTKPQIEEVDEVVEETSTLLGKGKTPNSYHATTSLDIPVAPPPPFVQVRQISAQSSGSGSNSGKKRGSKNSKSRDNRKKYLKTKVWIWWLTVISLLANLGLFVFKIYISVKSRSLAVMASAVDSFLDLVSQMIIYFALKGTREVDEEKYPVGRNRLEPIGIIVCASLMGIAAIQLLWESISTLIEGTVGGVAPEQLIPNVGSETVELLGTAIVIKIILFVVCNRFSDESDSIMVLAEDHRNDVISNAMALATAFLSNRYVRFWWLDPLGAIVISLYICTMWLFVAMEQAAMLEGAAADQEFLDQVKELSDSFHRDMFVDIVRAYHFGKRYLVEVEVVLPRNMTVEDAHDISLDLQKQIERLPRVERAFVHVDYTTRDENEHKAPMTPPTTVDGESDVDSIASSLDLDSEVRILSEVYADHHVAHSKDQLRKKLIQVHQHSHAAHHHHHHPHHHHQNSSGGGVATLIHKQPTIDEKQPYRPK